jgi:hypothetical protein
MGQPLKIEKKITGYKVISDEDKKQAEAAAQAAPAAPAANEPALLARPEVLTGTTYKLKSPVNETALYITINDYIVDEGTEHERRVPFEIFLNSKSMEHYQWIVALMRVMSAVFRKGGDVTFLVEELKSVWDPSGGYFKKGGGWCPSLIADIGNVVERHLKEIGHIKNANEELSPEAKAVLEEKRAKALAKESAAASPAVEGTYPASAAVCSKCSTKAVVVDGGCATCLHCGDSKCS